jgi:hypothetical protein
LTRRQNDNLAPNQKRLPMPGLDNVGSSTSHNPIDLYGLLQGSNRADIITSFLQKRALKVLGSSETRIERKVAEALGVSNSRVNNIKLRWLERPRNKNNSLRRGKTNKQGLCPWSYGCTVLSWGIQRSVVRWKSTEVWEEHFEAISRRGVFFLLYSHIEPLTINLRVSIKFRDLVCRRTRFSAALCRVAEFQQAKFNNTGEPQNIPYLGQLFPELLNIYLRLDIKSVSGLYAQKLCVIGDSEFDRLWKYVDNARKSFC